MCHVAVIRLANSEKSENGKRGQEVYQQELFTQCCGV